MNIREQKVNPDYIQEVVNQYNAFHCIPVRDFLERMQKGDPLAFNDLFRRSDTKTLSKKDLAIIEAFTKDPAVDVNLQNLLTGMLHHQVNNYQNAMKALEKVKDNPWKAFATTQLIIVKFKDIMSTESGYFEGNSRPDGSFSYLLHVGMFFKLLTYHAGPLRKKWFLAKAARASLQEAGKIDPEALALLTNICTHAGTREERNMYLKQAREKRSVTALEFGSDDFPANHAEAAKKGSISALTRLGINLNESEDKKSKELSILCFESAAEHNYLQAIDHLRSTLAKNDMLQKAFYLRKIIITEEKETPMPWIDAAMGMIMIGASYQFSKQQLNESYKKNAFLNPVLYFIITSLKGHYDPRVISLKWSTFSACLLTYDKQSSDPNIIAAVEMYVANKIAKTPAEFKERDKILGWLIWQNFKNNNIDRAMKLAHQITSPSVLEHEYSLAIGDHYCSGVSLGTDWQQKIDNTLHFQTIRGLDFLLSSNLDSQLLAIRKIYTLRGEGDIEEPTVKKTHELLFNVENLLLVNNIAAFDELFKTMVESKDPIKKAQMLAVVDILNIKKILQYANNQMLQTETLRTTNVMQFIYTASNQSYVDLFIKIVNDKQLSQTPNALMDNFLKLYCDNFLQRSKLEDKMQKMLNTSKKPDIATINEKQIDPELKEFYEREFKEDVDAIKIIKNAMKQNFKMPEEYFNYLKKHLAKNHHSLAVFTLANFVTEAFHVPNAANFLKDPAAPKKMPAEEKPDAFFKLQKPAGVNTIAVETKAEYSLR